MRRNTAITALAMMAIAASAEATVIDFEDFGNVGNFGPVVASQYPGVVFSSAGTDLNHVTTYSLGIGFGSSRNFLCTATIGAYGLNCAGETVLDWAAPVSGVSFWAIGGNNPGVTAKVDVYVGGAYQATRDVISAGDFWTPDLVDLSAFSGVTRIRIHGITDLGGLGWDNFAYTPTVASGAGGNNVPEPQTCALVLLGLGLIGLATRRGKQR